MTKTNSYYLEGDEILLTDEWKQLKSGTDIRGVASEGVAGEAVNLTDGTVAKLAGGFALWLSARGGKPVGALSVAVGYDSRVSAERIRDAVVGALVSAGVRVLDCGLASTPSMFRAVHGLSCDGSVQITASHHPWNRNGLKFFTPDGGLDGADIDAILIHAQNGDSPAPGKGSVTITDYMGRYCADLRDMIRRGVNAPNYEKPLEGFHIVVDAGNGAGGFYAKDVLAPLGADVSGSQFLEPDGMFPNHVPNPENEAAMRSVCDAVRKAEADLGVIFDTDVDRGGAVDAAGEEINRNRLVALASFLALENCPGGTVVTDSVTSSGLTEYIEKTLGGKHRRYKRGYRNVINEAVRLNREGVDCPLAIETSGHAAMRENQFLDDGAYLVTKIIMLAARLRREGRTIADLLAPLREPAEALELRFPILEADFRSCGERILAGLADFVRSQPGWAVAPENFEGVRVEADKGHGNGWFLLRLSVHDPILPLNVESDDEGGVGRILGRLGTYLYSCTGIDPSPLQKALN